ncbi:F-box only protein 43 [Struthio camelus australis]|uniref:F-box only protein 43 n=1 Tax=Struthio camelus australis TaxID=441894 RepID=A0A093HGZ9_STRCA|nr:PREDICTED: F-box only protein 43 [Struthio camelus australis]KFV81868.1 F-box only protein 43 [Struthio camelus australis]
MSESHSVMFNILKRNRLMSPNNNAKYSSFKDSCTSSVFLESRSNELLKDPNVEQKDAWSTASLSLLHEHSEHNHSNLLFPVSSSIEKEISSISLSERREANRSTDFFETPKVSKKDSSLRRRLLLSKTAPAGTTIGCCERQDSSSGSSRKKVFSCVLSFEETLSQTSGSPRVKSYKPLATSTSKTEESSPDSQKRRLSFSQQRSSTLDESKCKDAVLPEPECLSPIRSKDNVGNTNECSEGVLMSVSGGLLRTPTHSMLPEANENKSLKSISSLVEKFNFELCSINTPPVKLASYPDLSTPEDSGYNSLHLDKSGDSLSDHEGSFQEFIQKHKEASKNLDSKRKTRKLERVRRLSTLREQGSQSETEDDHHANPSNSVYILTEERNFVSADHALVSKDETNRDFVLNHGDLSRTPALQIVHEICLQSQRLDQNQISETVDGKEIFVLDVLAGLIGKKMGLEKLDILTELKYRNLKHVLAIVLDALTVESLCSIWKVSKNWREIVVQDKSADRRRKSYMKYLKEEAGGYFLKAEDAATRFNLLSRSALRPVQAQAKTPVIQTPPSCTELLTPMRCNSAPRSISRQEEYIKVAKTLFTDEALKPCPRCQYPAKYQLVKKRGLCSREACAFDFCILCLHAFHGSKDCSSLSAKRQNKKDAPPGSAQSKRNLKRL